ncbi:unnamed protein product, partial [Didymodactylos carnosus]
EKTDDTDNRWGLIAVTDGFLAGVKKLGNGYRDLDHDEVGFRSEDSIWGKRANEMGPLRVFEENIEKANPSLLDAGNFTSCPTITAIKAMAAEYRQENQLDQDYHSEVRLLSHALDIADTTSNTLKVKHGKEQFNDFDLRVMGYRRTQINSAVAEHDVLIFVENTQSFAFLLDVGNWPVQLVGKEYSRKMPSIPPQLSGVIQNGAFNVDWDEFVQDIKRQYARVINFDTVRNEFLEGKYVYVHFMRYPVVEYMALTQVLIFSRCMQIGHFQKNCPQKDEVTCKRCGAKCADIKKHECQGVPKCIRYGGDYKSSDTKCPKVKDYRAALTRTLPATRNNVQVTQPV